MMVDTSAYFGQTGVVPSPFVPQGLFSHLPGQPGLPIWPTIGGSLGQPQLAGCMTPGLFGYVPGQYASPIWPTIAGSAGHPHLAGFVPPAYAPTQFGVPTAPFIGGWPGQALLASQITAGAGPFGRALPFETGLQTIMPGFAHGIGGWLPQQQLLAQQLLAQQLAQQQLLAQQLAQQQLLAGMVGRSSIPYHATVPQMAYAGV